MAYEQKDGDIAVFKVKDKTNPKGPDWTGKAIINGEEMQVSFWQKNDTMLAGQIKEKFKPNYAEAREAVAKTKPVDDMDDSEIPF
jgi:hypothetical protein